MGSAPAAQQCVQQFTLAAKAAKAAVGTPTQLHASGLRVVREEMDHTPEAGHTMMHFALSATDLVLEPEEQAPGVAQPSQKMPSWTTPAAACSRLARARGPSNDSICSGK